MHPVSWLEMSVTNNSEKVLRMDNSLNPAHTSAIKLSKQGYNRYIMAMSVSCR